jgi:prevent-host-death family protein
MRQVNATDMKQHFGEFLDLVRDGSIEIRKTGKTAAYLVSPEEYEHLQALEDAYWAAQAEVALARGEFLSPDETMRWINQRLSAGA